MVIIGGAGEAPILRWISGKVPSGCDNAAYTTDSSSTSARFLAASPNTLTTKGEVTLLDAKGLFGGKLALRVRKERLRMGLAPVQMDLTNEEQLVALLMNTAACAIAAGYYRSLEHHGRRGEAKIALAEVQPCSELECLCRDYDRNIPHAGCLFCGHSSTAHKRSQLDDAVVLRWLLREVAAEFYPRMSRRDPDGHFKTQLDRVTGCVYAKCSCHDFDLCETDPAGRCRCGHRAREHQWTGQWDWLVIGLAQEVILQWARE